ncbi:alpha,alpha-trehalose-phosphate synthase (UDP-forming) [Pollutimonas thiosulfatoxidans]|uniref:Trehalose-6-phosphate synthase n=1 Tax=Pollutimonas thiosulfatoxidans TaxID=2028345 RepID=A0A410GG50_9BURK|nr:alpha,alpha-trehalose-phosphate synthase (UDP-forming) [Pollutimonas thiosulfatoxidans]MBF6618092.1 alpha,alpha-trehalose-phosphate synthase (UDP-forming) [Candidimonas sp.]QAA95283.1 alpha,alpha-trehalose-phosphate synthase (UDP-forming) [Pollutimonas thiosulfatoxidans]
MSRLIVVSNRVAPITEGKSTAGGLVVGVLDALRETGGIWLGWSGDISGEPSTAPVTETVDNIDFCTIPLTQRDYDRYYRGFSNGVLWPTFHYRIDLSQYNGEDYKGYVEVNQRFAALLATLAQPTDRLWVHDYHLIPLAQACREQGLDNRIGFFLHIPFPSPSVLRTIPRHRELVLALCQYDLVGFQTQGDTQAFVDYATRHLDGVLEGDILQVGERRIRVGSYPIGIHPDQVKTLSKQSARSKQLDALKAGLQHRKLIVSVDRLDYSKGLVQRFDAFDCLLETAPQHRGKVTLVQIAPPSRQDVQGYRQIRRQLESAAGRINGKWTELSWTPIRYMNRSYERSLLMSFFRASQVGLVTPMRDGMNLVAKEYIASQPADDPGVLVLSEFAGAAAEMQDGAIMVNPFDTKAMADGLDLALRMPLQQRKKRYEHLMEVLRANDLSRWRDRFLGDLES